MLVLGEELEPVLELGEELGEELEPVLVLVLEEGLEPVLGGELVP